MLFDYLKAITVNKDSNLPLDEYSPFLMNRWISFMSPSISNLINDTLNQLGNIDKDFFKIIGSTQLISITENPRLEIFCNLVNKWASTSNVIIMVWFLIILLIIIMSFHKLASIYFNVRRLRANWQEFSDF